MLGLSILTNSTTTSQRQAKMSKLVTSGYIAKLFKQADKNTIIRRPNLRRFAEQSGVEYYVHDTAWLINFDDFMSKINPQGEQVKCEMPLLRNKHDSLIRFNRTHKYAVDKHTIDRCTASDNVSKFLHGRIWIINYRELEKEIERRVEEGSEKKREKL